MQHKLSRSFLSLCALLAILQGCATEPESRSGRGGGGVMLAANAVVFCGFPSNCSRPATLDFDKVRAATPEWKTISADAVQTGSARYNLLISKMHERIQAAATKVAKARGHDLVVRAGDITDANGMKTTDVTAEVIGG